MSKKKEITTVYSYEVIMLVHIVADNPEQARTKLDDQGGIVTKREVKLLNASPLYGEKEKE
jgi:hypothetical protein